MIQNGGFSLGKGKEKNNSYPSSYLKVYLSQEFLSVYENSPKRLGSIACPLPWLVWSELQFRSSFLILDRLYELPRWWSIPSTYLTVTVSTFLQSTTLGTDCLQRTVSTSGDGCLQLPYQAIPVGPCQRWRRMAMLLEIERLWVLKMMPSSYSAPSSHYGIWYESLGEKMIRRWMAQPLLA